MADIQSAAAEIRRGKKEKRKKKEEEQTNWYATCSRAGQRNGIWLTTCFRLDLSFRVIHRV